MSNAARKGDKLNHGGEIVSGSPDVFINDKPAARVTDIASCSKHPGSPPIVTGSATIFINGLPAATIGDKISCGGVIIDGSANVFIGGGSSGGNSPDVLDNLPTNESALNKGINRGCVTGDPVNTITGEVIMEQIDFTIPGRIPLPWTRHYGSLSARTGL